MSSRNIIPIFITALAAMTFMTQPALPQSINQDGVNIAQSPLRSPIPDENTLARLVWTTMVALDNANRTSNYSVIHALGSPDFQRRNSPAQLEQSFTELRQNRVDVGRAILMTPSYYIPPQILDDGSLRLRGGFDYRPKSIRFDLVFKNIIGGWSLSAISVVEIDSGTQN